LKAQLFAPPSPLVKSVTETAAGFDKNVKRDLQLRTQELQLKRQNGGIANTLKSTRCYTWIKF